MKAPIFRYLLFMSLALLMVCACVPANCSAESAQSIVDTMLAKKKERERGLGSFIIDQVTAGQRQLLYFEKNYDTHEFRVIPQHEIVADKALEKGWSPDHTKATTLGLAWGGDEVRRAMGRELGLSMNDPIMMTARNTLHGLVRMGSALPTTAEYVAQKGKDADAEKQEVFDIRKFGRIAALSGTETLHGREAYVLKADDLDMAQVNEHGKFVIQSASMWVDKMKYVPLRIRFEGTAKSGGKTQSMVIEKDSMDYKSKGTLYLPYKEIMRISGLMNDSQKAEMKRAEKELEKLQTQLEGPQKEMILQMMGPQIKQLKNMARGRGVEVVTDVRKVVVPANRESYMTALVGGDGAIEATQ